MDAESKRAGLRTAAEAVRRFKQALMHKPTSERHLKPERNECNWRQNACVRMQVQILNNIGLVYAKCQDYAGAYEWCAWVFIVIALEVHARTWSVPAQVREGSQTRSQRCQGRRWMKMGRRCCGAQSLSAKVETLFSCAWVERKRQCHWPAWPPIREASQQN